MRITRLAGFAVAGLVALSACGDGNNGPSQPTTPTPPPTITETIVLLSDSGSFPAEVVGYLEFAIPTAGTLDATVDWTFASSMVWVAVTTNACDDFEAAFLSSCSHIGNPHTGRTIKPKTVSGSAPAGAGRIWIVNFAEVDESVAVHVTLTRTRNASEPVLERAAWRFVPASPAEIAALRAAFDRGPTP